MNKNEIIQRFSIPDFVEKTKNQIRKEFFKVGVSIPIKEDIKDKDSLVLDLKDELNAIIDQHPQLLAQLFYSIDLPEEKVKNVMNSNEDITRNIAELILFRAAQKVYTREKFSG